LGLVLSLLSFGRRNRRAKARSFFPLGREKILMLQKQSSGHLQNRLLAALAPNSCSLFSADLRAATFKQGAMVQEAGEPVDQIYFPQTGMISLLVVTQEGIGIEAASIGCEGAVGLHRGLGKRRSFTRAVVQISGTMSHISADMFERAVGQSDSIKDMITHYTEVLWVEAQQIAACNSVHSAEARFARWLLQTQDRIGSSLLPLTQEFLSQMLGVRRTTVTLVARALQQAGLIKYSRGRIVILDRAGLEEAACECYQIIHHETLPGIIGVNLAPA
jgi:CRP-like cAMP-binding protein